MLTHQWDALTGDKQTTIIGYEITSHFIPPHDILNRSHLFSKMLAICIEAGESFQKKATDLLSTACQMKVCESQARTLLYNLPKQRMNECIHIRNRPA